MNICIQPYYHHLLYIVLCRVWHLFPDTIYKRAPDLGREGLVPFDCWYMCGAEEWNTVHSARLRYAVSPRSSSFKYVLSGNI